MNRIYTLYFPLFVLFVLSASAYDEKDFLSATHTFNTTTLGFRLFVPPGYSPDSLYPLVLTLHGAGRRGNDNENQIAGSSVTLSWVRNDVPTKHPCFVVTPQCPNDNKWVDTDWEKGNYDLSKVPLSNEMLTVMDLVDSLIKIFPIDTNRLYVAGNSMGGYGTWNVILNYPGKFAAAVPVCGAGDKSLAGLLSDMPIWAFHGNADPTVPVSGSRDMMSAIQNMGANVLFSNCNLQQNCTGMPAQEFADSLKKSPMYIYTELDGVDHNSWDPAFLETPGLYDWVFSKTREVPPVSIASPDAMSGSNTRHQLAIGSVGVFDINGTLVKTVYYKNVEFKWDGTNQNGDRVGTGIYFVKNLFNSKGHALKVFIAN
ncbi:MAG: prolyl oligopeptidase family serine peptidase [Fibrobacteria bacterium]|nr:prolyl oligopeptidase family serine peptidase [Fibrobacteria bacterium]